jgi:hypothetical protein
MDCFGRRTTPSFVTFFATLHFFEIWKIPGSAEAVQPRRNRTSRRTLVGYAAGVAALWALVGMACPALAEDAPSPPIVDLDRLLVLPDSLDLEPETRGGATKAEWRARFQSAREDFAAARAALAKTQTKLEDVASGTSSWKMGAPGLGVTDLGATADSPLDYSLSNEMRRNREEVERSERRLTELRIEANLAGVPRDWQGLEPTETPSASQEPK